MLPGVGHALGRRVARAGAHIAGGLDALLPQPQLVVKAVRVQVAVRRFQAHRHLPALAGAQLGRLAGVGAPRPGWRRRTSPAAVVAAAPPRPQPCGPTPPPAEAQPTSLRWGMAATSPVTACRAPPAPGCQRAGRKPLGAPATGGRREHQQRSQQRQQGTPPACSHFDSGPAQARQGLQAQMLHKPQRSTAPAAAAAGPAPARRPPALAASSAWRPPGSLCALAFGIVTPC
jgi:hypothetical protein